MVNGRKQGMTQAELARGLDISPPMVSKLKARGMPVHALAEARAWREDNLDPCLVKQIRRPELCRQVEGPESGLVAVANEQGVLALDALTGEAWRDFVDHVEALRAVLIQLNDAEDDRVRLPTQIWEALCGLPGPWLGKGVRYECKT